jgi:hypothetical protein
MTTATLRFAQITPDYRSPVKPRPEQIRQVAKLWFNKRKLRQQARYLLSFANLPRHVTLKYKLR